MTERDRVMWQDLLDKDDRTSPEEYPDMALITFEEFTAVAAAAREEGRREERKAFIEWLRSSGFYAAYDCLLGVPTRPHQGDTKTDDRSLSPEKPKEEQ